MKRFRRILTGVDLASDERLISPDLTAPNREAVRQAIDLASESGAEVCFLAAIDVSAATQRLIEEHLGRDPNLFDEAYAELQKLVDQAAERGVKAKSVVSLGKSWMKLIQHVVDDNHDLVVVGTRTAGPVERVLFGSTAMKLLRYCPCPVWVTKPVEDDGVRTVLVAHDFTEIGRHALDLGASLAELWKGELIALHGLELMEYMGLPVAPMADSELDMRLEAARNRIATEAAALDAKVEAEIEVVTGSPEQAILKTIADRGVDVIVMGTMARTGISGLLIGNTAERLLPRLQCSVVAIKPDDFECPVSVSEHHEQTA